MASPFERFVTPYEAGNGNQTATYEECIAFYHELAKKFPHVLQFQQIGVSDGGAAVYAGIVMNDVVTVPNFSDDSDVARLKASGRPIFFNDNGIHPGEPEGIDCCMAVVRDFCLQPEKLRSLEQVIFLFVPIYNVDGCINRNNSSRVNQVGPEFFGFRANSLNLDQNRDFVKCDSKTSQLFNNFFTRFDPEVMVDTHCSNGADYQYTMTLIHTQPDKLGGSLGAFLKMTMIPEIYTQMGARGWPTCPYVNPVAVIPDDGIEDFVESPRYSTGMITEISVLCLVIVDVTYRVHRSSALHWLHAGDPHAEILQGPIRLDACTGRCCTELHSHSRCSHSATAGCYTRSVETDLNTSVGLRPIVVEDRYQLPIGV